MTSLNENSRKAKKLLLLKFLSFLLILSLTSCKSVKTENHNSSNASVSNQIDSETGLTKAKEDGFFIAQFKPKYGKHTYTVPEYANADSVKVRDLVIGKGTDWEINGENAR